MAGSWISVFGWPGRGSQFFRMARPRISVFFSDGRAADLSFFGWPGRGSQFFFGWPGRGSQFFSDGRVVDLSFGLAGLVDPISV